MGIYVALDGRSCCGCAERLLVRFRFGALEKIVATPRYHAFHHAAEAEAVDKNFAFHLPIIDRIFGTQYLPDRAWPARYGIRCRP